MTHLRALSSKRVVDRAVSEPAVADAKSDFLNSVWWSVQDLMDAKKTAVPG
jgi:hypothetical protein